MGPQYLRRAVRAYAAATAAALLCTRGSEATAYVTGAIASRITNDTIEAVDAAIAAAHRAWGPPRGILNDAAATAVAIGVPVDSSLHSSETRRGSSTSPRPLGDPSTLPNWSLLGKRRRKGTPRPHPTGPFREELTEGTGPLRRDPRGPEWDLA